MSDDEKICTLPRRSVVLDDSWDVIVAGGGPAGCAAAAAAAREGAETLLLERTGSLGGMATSGLVTSWAPFSDKQGTIIYGGIAERVFRKTREGMPHVPEDKLDWVVFNPEQLKRYYDELVTSAGVTVRFNTTVCATENGDDGEVSTLVTAGKNGMTAYSAGVFVDCTGDGDVAAWSGVPFYKGDPETEDLQPASLCFLLANVDTEAYQEMPSLHPENPDSPIYEIAESDRYPGIVDPHCCNALLCPGVVTFNAGHIWEVDGTDTASVSSGLMKGRKVAEQYRAALAEYCPEAFGNAAVVSTAPSMGIRESRRIIGDYTLTVDDYVRRRKFPDEIGRNNYWIDIHTARDEIEESNEGHDHVRDRFEHYGPGESHGIPYRCLLPRGPGNLLVAGRCISCDRPVQGAIRVMPACLVTGEAAGVAAGMAIGGGSTDVRSVDPTDLRHRLIDCGAYLPQEDG